jgi:SAM-dependent methyltransferase
MRSGFITLPQRKAEMPFYENFSAHQPTNAGAWMADQEASNVLRTILKVKPDVRSVLEIGPGRGPFMRACASKYLDYTCVDISWTLLQGLTGVRRINALVPLLPVSSDSIDLAFASNVLEHMLDFRAALAFVGEMARVVQPGGLVCHRVPNVMAWGMHFWNGDYTHSFATTPRNVSQLYLDLGLKVEAWYPVTGPLVGGGARLLALLGKLIPSWMVADGADPTARVVKSIYSLKTSFLLGFLIVGRKV